MTKATSSSKGSEDFSSLISAINDLETLSEPKKRLIRFLKEITGGVEVRKRK